MLGLVALVHVIQNCKAHQVNIQSHSFSELTSAMHMSPPNHVTKLHQTLLQPKVTIYLSSASTHSFKQKKSNHHGHIYPSKPYKGMAC